MEIDAGELDAVAPIRRRGRGETRAQQSDRVILRIGAQHVEVLRRQRRRFIGAIVDGEIERHRRADGGEQHIATRGEPRREGETRKASATKPALSASGRSAAAR